MSASDGSAEQAIAEAVEVTAVVQVRLQSGTRRRDLRRRRPARPARRRRRAAAHSPARRAGASASRRARRRAARPRPSASSRARTGWAGGSGCTGSRGRAQARHQERAASQIDDARGRVDLAEARPCACGLCPSGERASRSRLGDADAKRRSARLQSRPPCGSSAAARARTVGARAAGLRGRRRAEASAARGRDPPPRVPARG